MASRINSKARIDRHLRILKDNIGKNNPFLSFYYKFNYNVVILLVIFLFPIYPIFSTFFYEGIGYDFYRGDIDETTILDSYIDGEETSFIISNDSFISLNTLIEGKRDTSEYSEVIEYEVKSGDSLALIAQNFGVTQNSILWANNFDAKKVLHPGDIIKVPPVSGLIHEVKSGDTISELAKKYKVDESKILSQNKLEDGGNIDIGRNLIIPGAVKEVPKPVVTQVKAPASNPQAQGGYTFTSGGSSEFVNTDGTYQLVARTPQWTFYWGNCTRFVAQYKNVNWSGNAKDWLRNAAAKGHPTGKNPGLGAIVVFNGKGYNPYYGHVGIVVDVTATDIIVKDMNYRRLNEITVRKVPKTDGAIQGYIYVD